MLPPDEPGPPSTPPGSPSTPPGPAAADTVLLPTVQDTVLLPTVQDTVLLPTVHDTAAAGAGGAVTAAGEAGGGSETESVARNSAVMAVGSIISRATGFLRAAALAAALGAGAVNDNYTLANTLPNMVYELLLGGMLAGVIVPVLVRARRVESDGGEAYTQRLLTLSAVFFGAATVLAVVAAPLLTALMVNDRTPAADRSLITILAYLLLPEIFFYGMAAMFSAILNVRGHFAAPMWTPILNNLIVTVTAGTFALLHTGAVETDSLAATEIAVLGVGTTLGIVVQAVGLWPALRGVGFRWRWRWDFRRLRLRELANLGSWMLAYVAMTEVGVLVVLAIAKRAGDRHGWGPAVYNNGFLVFMMAHGIVAVSIMTALMPRMSAAAADGRKADFAAQLSLGTRLSAVILVPASVGYVVLGRPLAITLFQLGHYGPRGAAATGWVIAAAGLALVPYAISQLQTFAFYALDDPKAPALINIPMVLARLAIGGLLLAVVSPDWVVSGLMAGSAVSFALGTGLGYWVLRRRVGRLGLMRVIGTLTRLTVAAVAGGVVAVPIVWLLSELLGSSKIASALQLTVGALVLLAGYLGVAVVLRVPEIREVGELVGRRFRRA